MKIPIAISILILLAAALIGVPGCQRLTAIRESHAKLVAAAAQRGISINTTHTDAPIRIFKRERNDHATETRHIVAEFAISYAKQMTAEVRMDNELRMALQIEMLELLTLLDVRQFKILLTEFCDVMDLEDEERRCILAAAIVSCGEKPPQVGVIQLTECAHLLGINDHTRYILAAQLARWAKEDPLAAVDWLKNNSAKFPGLITDEVKQDLIFGTAAQDPKLACQLVSELDFKNAAMAISYIIGAADTPSERTDALTALREQIVNASDEKIIGDLAANTRLFVSDLVKEGFDSSSKWLAEVKMTPLELESFVGWLSRNVSGKENGKWIGWLGENLPADEAAPKIRDMLRNWTMKDHQAAGEWLTSAADGPTKNTAIRSYAETVSKYEPQTAAQWALTLPPGKDRDATLKSIYQNWPREDATAREAFKQAQGIN